MAISFDKSAVSNNSGTTSSVTLAAAEANEIALIFIGVDSTMTINTPTVNGSTTGVVQVGTTYSWNGERKFAVYYQLNPTTSSVVYQEVATTANGLQFHVALYKGVNQAAPDSSAQIDSASTNVTLTTTVVAANCWVVGTAWVTGAGTASMSAGAATTLRNNDGVTSSALGDSNGTVGTGAQSIIINGSRTHGGGLAVSIAPVPPVTNNAMLNFF